MGCSVSNCQKAAHVRGMCDVHYRRWLRHGDPLITHKRGWKYGMEKKTTLAAMMKPTMRDLSWAAGFIEGEGCCDKQGGSSRLNVEQVNREPIDRLLSLFGGAAKFYRKRKFAIHKTQPNPTWNWYVSGSRARGVMLTLYALMSAKRQGQIRRALLT